MSTGGAGVDPPQEEKAPKQKKVTQQLDLISVRPYLPPNSHIAHESRFNRVRGYSTACGKHNHKCQLSYGVDVAVRVVLRWLWAQHLLAHPDEKCPYDFPYTID